MENEVWKDIPNYEGLYQVSNLGRVKSLGNDKTRKEKILKPIRSSNGYLYIELKGKSFRINVLVAMAFLNHTPCGHILVVDHINNIKTDNRLENLQILTNRQNLSRHTRNCTSKYTGVCFDKNRNKWLSKIVINGKQEFLGRFINEHDAHTAYQNKLKEIEQL